ncbi:hypothetical protein LguiB_018603 [Lonicera macranthoides]
MASLKEQHKSDLEKASNEGSDLASSSFLFEILCCLITSLLVYTDPISRRFVHGSSSIEVYYSNVLPILNVMPVKEGGLTSSHVLKSELKSVSLPRNSIPNQQLNGTDTSH